MNGFHIKHRCARLTSRASSALYVIKDLHHASARYGQSTCSVDMTCTGTAATGLYVEWTSSSSCVRRVDKCLAYLLRLTRGRHGRALQTHGDSAFCRKLFWLFAPLNRFRRRAGAYRSAHWRCCMVALLACSAHAFTITTALCYIAIC